MNPPGSGKQALALAAGCAAAWAVGAAIARRIGLWRGIGVTAVTLGAAATMLHRRSIARALRPDADLLLQGAAGGVALTTATYLLFPALSYIPSVRSGTVALYGVFGPMTRRRLVALPVVILCEEVVWRGLVQDALSVRSGDLPGVGLTALLYASAHLPTGRPLLGAAALGCGIAWSGLRAESHSLVPPLVCHLIWDAAILIVYPLVREW